jgi:hypothetical protein
MNVNQIRLGLSLTGMVVAIVAIMRNDRRIVWGAIVLLAASLLLRLVTRNRPGRGRDGNVT